MEARMLKANRGGWKTCSRGHKYRGAGPDLLAEGRGAAPRRIEPQRFRLL